MGDPRLGSRLKELRTAAGFTQQGLADKAGVSRKTINTVENGVFIPSTIVALALARALNTTVEAIFYLKD